MTYENGRPASPARFVLEDVPRAAFCLSWGQGWQGDRLDIHYMSDDPDEQEQRALAAVGHTCAWLNQEEGEERLRRRIALTIQRGARRTPRSPAISNRPWPNNDRRQDP